MKWTFVTLLIGTLALLPRLAHAQAQPDSEARKKSDEHFQEGARLYHAGEYSSSILELKDGYRLAPHPVFLVNIALAYARLENWQEAANFGRRATTEEGLDATAAAQTGGRAEAWSIRHHVDSTVASMNALADQEESLVDVEDVVEPARGGRLGVLGWTGIAGAGIGAVGIGTAIFIGASLEDERDAYEAAAQAGDQAEFDRLADVIEDRQFIGQVLLYSGAGLMAVGGTLLIVDLLGGESKPTVAISPAGVSARWAW